MSDKYGEPTPLEEDIWQQHHELYDLIFEQAFVGIAYTSISGHLLEVNQQFCNITGYSREELLERTFEDITHPEDVETSYALVSQSLTDTIPSGQIEKRYIRKDGTTVWTRLTTKLLRLPSGEPRFFMSLVEDITAQKQAEEERARALERTRAARAEAIEKANELNTIFGTLTEMVVVYDREGRLLRANAAAQAFFHTDSTEDQWFVPYQQRHKRYQARDEHGQPLLAEQMPLYRILRGEVLSGSNTVDFIIRLETGQDVYLNASGTPIYNEQGQITGAVCVFRDVTERLQRERRTLWTLDSLLTLVEELVRIPEQVDALSADEIPTSSSDIHVVGRRLVNLINQVLRGTIVALIMLDPPNDRLRLVAASSVTSEQEQRYQAQLGRFSLSDYLDSASIAKLRANGVVIRDLTREPIELLSRSSLENLLAVPMFIGKELVGIFAVNKASSEGVYTTEEIVLVKAAAKLAGLVIERGRLLREWAEARASELALQEANRRFDAFLSIASHELRTPLTTIKGNVQLALRRLDILKRQGTDQSEALINNLERIQHPLQYAVHRVSVQDRMISDLLDVTRIQANKLQMLMKKCNLVEIVRTTVEDVQYFAASRAITLHMPAQEVVPIIADADRIGQVINNYLTNALKYSPAERPVELSLTVEGAMARVAVRDEGPGLSPEDQKLVWERFYRAKEVEVQYGSGPGLGLGLYICRTIIESHHGQVGVTSEEGKGSTFWFTLPLAATSEKR